MALLSRSWRGSQLPQYATAAALAQEDLDWESLCTIWSLAAPHLTAGSVGTQLVPARGGVISGNTYLNELVATKSPASLQMGARVKGSQKPGDSATYRVSDGGAVSGPTVTLYGKRALPKLMTDMKGQVTLDFAKGTKSESIRIVSAWPTISTT